MKVDGALVALPPLVQGNTRADREKARDLGIGVHLLPDLSQHAEGLKEPDPEARSRMHQIRGVTIELAVGESSRGDASSVASSTVAANRWVFAYARGRWRT